MQIASNITINENNTISQPMINSTELEIEKNIVNENTQVVDKIPAIEIASQIQPVSVIPIEKTENQNVNIEKTNIEPVSQVTIPNTNKTDIIEAEKNEKMKMLDDKENLEVPILKQENNTNIETLKNENITVASNLREEEEKILPIVETAVNLVKGKFILYAFVYY